MGVGAAENNAFALDYSYYTEYDADTMFYDAAETMWAFGVLTIKPLFLTTASDYDVDIRFYEAAGAVWAVRVLGITEYNKFATSGIIKNVFNNLN